MAAAVGPLRPVDELTMGRLRQHANAMTLAEHLTEARRRFLICVGAVAVLATAAFALYPHLLSILQAPYCHASPGHCQFLVTNPLDGLTLRFKLSLYSGLLASFPVFLWQLWRFVTPGLKSSERKYALPFIAASLIFFAGGVVVAYISFNHALSWLEQIGGRQLITDYNPNQYMTLFVLMMFVFGLMFEFPVLLVALQLGRVVTPRQLLARWRYAIIVITIVAAAITPSSDPFSMLALAIPLTVFYFLAIGVGKLCRR